MMVADSEALLYRMGVLYIRLEWWDVAAPDAPRPHRILNTRFGEFVIDGLAEGHEYAVEVCPPSPPPPTHSLSFPPICSERAHGHVFHVPSPPLASF